MRKNAVIFFVTLVLLIATACRSAMPMNGGTQLHSIVRLHDKVTGRFFCSAVVVSPTLAITAAHCLAWIEAERGTPSILVQATKDSTINVEAAVVSFEQRSDQGLITGDFRIFHSRAVETRPDVLEDIWLGNHKLVACGYPYAGDLVCTRVTDVAHMFFQFSGNGFLYPGMSGGPIIDLTTGTVIGVNTAVDANRIIMSPTANIFDNLKGR